MGSFEVYTTIGLTIYAPHPLGTTNLTASATYANDDGMPPYIGSGLIIPASGRAYGWAAKNLPDDPSVINLPNDLKVKATDKLYTAHMIIINNKIGIDGEDPCLQSAPIVSESLPGLTAGVVDTQGVSFVLTNPRWQRYLSSDFVSAHSGVVMTRTVIGHDPGVVWSGVITSVRMSGTNTTVAARSLIKRLDQKATFGFDDEILKWKPDHRIPIICARMIPYSVNVLAHPPQVVSPYTLWRQEYAQFLRDFQPEEDDNDDGGGG